MASRAAAMAQAASASSFLGRSQSGGAASTSSSAYDSSPPVRLHGLRPSSLSSRKLSSATKLLVAQRSPVDTSRRKAGPRASAVLPHWTDPRASFPSIPVQDTTSAPSPRFDKWLTQAAGEIVRHLEEAPFLHYVFDGITREGSPQFQQVSAGEAAGWENIQSQVQAVSPDGVILVQRLGVEAAAKCYGEEYAETQAVENCAKIEGCPYATGPRTDVWGLVVQGRRNPKHACYILKTTRAVGCSHACTRFSLTRATCFGPSLHKQLENSWLAS
jgi:hypothetical protein